MAKTRRTEAQDRTLDAALVYAGFGFSVMPVNIATKIPHKAGKHSNGKRWGATKDPKQIKRDFNRWPNAAIGIPTGIDNEIWVLEADSVKGHGVDGIANLKALIDANSPLPETRMAHSPSARASPSALRRAGKVLAGSDANAPAALTSATNATAALRAAAARAHPLLDSATSAVMSG